MLSFLLLAASLSAAAANTYECAKVTTVGTAALTPGGGRAGPCTVVSVGSQESGCFEKHYVFDLGHGSTQRMADGRFQMRDVEAVFITHAHIDHAGEVGEFAFQHWIQSAFWGYEDLEFVVPEGELPPIVSAALDPYQYDIAQRSVPGPPVITVNAFSNPTEPTMVYASGDGVEVFAVKVKHRVGLEDSSYMVNVNGVGSVVISGDIDDDMEASTRPLLKFKDVVAPSSIDVLVHQVKSSLWRTPLVGVHTAEAAVAERAVGLDVGALMLTHLIPSPCYPSTGPFQGGITPGGNPAFAIPYLLDDDYSYMIQQGGYYGELVVADDLSSVTIPSLDLGVTCGSKAMCDPIPDDYVAARPQSDSGNKYRFCDLEDEE